MKIRKLLITFTSLILLFTVSLIGLSFNVSADETEYYVTYSTDNYSRKQKNIMTYTEITDSNEDGSESKNCYYVLENVELDSTIRFRVESKNGAVYYAKNGQAMAVSASTTSKYTIYFSLDYIYDEAHTSDTDPKITTSDAHISYSAYLKPSYYVCVSEPSDNTDSSTPTTPTEPTQAAKLNRVTKNEGDGNDGTSESTPSESTPSSSKTSESSSTSESKPSSTSESSSQSSSESSSSSTSSSSEEIKIPEGTYYELKFNQYNSSYDEYYLDEIELKAGNILTFTTNKKGAVNYSTESETYKVEKDGLYKILYTPGKTEDNKDYRFNEDGVYGEGEDYKYFAYITEASQYFIEYKDTYTSKYIESDKIDFDYEGNTIVAYKLTYNRDSNAGGYISKEFFVSLRDTNFNYNIYKLEDSVYTRIDDDNDEDTVVSKIDVEDVNWYKVSFFILGNEKYKTTITKQDRAINDYYISSNTNNYLFDEYGNRDLSDNYKFTKIEENDDTDLYTSDYEQYTLTINVDQYVARNNLEFYITNGVDDYKDSSDYISINTAGKYEIIFSPDHIYSRTRHYKYSLIKETSTNEEINISSLEDFLNFVAYANKDSNYTINKTFNLTCDIDLTNQTIESIKEFHGIFEGHFHRIKNLSISTDETKDTISLFNLVTKEASISNLYFDNININAKNCSYVGVISKLYGKVEDVTFDGVITGNSYVGPIAYMGNYVLTDSDNTTDSTKKYGYSYATNVNNKASIYGKVYVGGICGYNGGRIVESENNGDVNNKSYPSNDNVRCIGGLAGYSVGEIISSSNKSVVGYKTIGSFIGGLAGLSNGAFYFSNNYGNVYGRNNVGGIVGYYTTVTKDSDYSNYFGETNYEDILNSFLQSDSTELDESQDLKKNVIYYVYNNGDVFASSQNVGGICGLVDISSTIRGSISKANITLDTGDYCGGLVGQMSNGTLLECIAYGNVYSNGSSAKYTGGVVGYLNGTISYVSSYTVLNGYNYIGGVAGYISSTSKVISTTSDCYIIKKENSSYIGNVCGYAACLNEADSTFNEQVKYNYYIDNDFKGINGVNYKELDAAIGLTRDEFISLNTLPIKFDNRFGGDYFVGGTEELSYVYLLCFEEMFEIDNFDVTLDIDALGKVQINNLFNIEKSLAKKSNIIVYMELKNKGDLTKDDGSINYDDFEINSIIRVYEGDKIVDPDFMHTTTLNDVCYYSDDNNKYVVTWNKTGENVIYAKYEIITTTLSSTDGFILVEGEFLPGTTLKIVQNGDNYSLKFYRDDVEYFYNDIVVKVKDLDKTIYICNGSDKEKVEYASFGDYQRFALSNSKTEFLLMSKAEIIQPYTYVLFGVGGTIVVTLIITTVILISRKKKNKKVEQE